MSLLLFGKEKTQFNWSFSPYSISKHFLTKEADVVHLHWVAHFLDYKALAKLNKPIVWTLHDMQAFLGGFHYLSYQEQHQDYQRLDEMVRIGKEKALRNMNNLTIVSPSQWLLNLSEHSSLFQRFPHKLIPYGLSLETFCTMDKKEAQRYFSISTSKKVVVTVAESFADPRKGAGYLVEALKMLDPNKYLLITVGEGHLQDLKMEQKSLGFVGNEHALAQSYAAADVFVITSVEDNLPNTVLEALACGIPVVGFAIGGIPEMVMDGVNGNLVEKGDIAQLSKVLSELLEDDTSLKQMALGARATAIERFSMEQQANRYKQLYRSILE